MIFGGFGGNWWKCNFKVRGLSTVFTGGSKGQGRNEC